MISLHGKKIVRGCIRRREISVGSNGTAPHLLEFQLAFGECALTFSILLSSTQKVVSLVRRRALFMKYTNCDEASVAAIVLGIRTRPEYRKRYTEDSRLPAHPNRFYGG